MKTVTDQLQEKLEKDQEYWNSKIKTLIKMIDNPDSLSEAQVYMLSYRHNIVEKLVEFRNILGKQKSNNYQTRKEKYRWYKTQYDLRMNQSEINAFIDADLRDEINKINLLDTHLYFYQQSIETLDKLGFAIKNRIQMAQTYL